MYQITIFNSPFRKKKGSLRLQKIHDQQKIFEPSSFFAAIKYKRER